MALTIKKSNGEVVRTLTTIPERYLSVGEAAEHIGFSKSYLNQLRCKKQGPGFTKVGRCVRYRISDIERWMSERKSSGSPKSQ